MAVCERWLVYLSVCGVVMGGGVGNIPTLIGTWSLLTSVIVLVVASADILSNVVGFVGCM